MDWKPIAAIAALIASLALAAIAYALVTGDETNRADELRKCQAEVGYRWEQSVQDARVANIGKDFTDIRAVPVYSTADRDADLKECEQLWG